MRNLGDSLRKLTNQLITEAAGTPDRPTSLYSAGTVGGPTPRRPLPDSAVPSDMGAQRSRDFTVEPEATTNVEEQRRPRQRPVTAPRRIPVNQGTRLRAMLRSPQSLRTAIVVSEVLGPPVALRDERR
jgi:hypothetical protein